MDPYDEQKANSKSDISGRFLLFYMWHHGAQSFSLWSTASGFHLGHFSITYYERLLLYIGSFPNKYFSFRLKEILIVPMIKQRFPPFNCCKIRKSRFNTK